MFCPKCGNQLVDGAKFCANCGTGITPKQVSTQSTKTPRKKKKLIIGISIAAAVVLIGVCVVLFFVIFNKPIPVKININIENYSAENCTKIPVKIASDGEDKVYFVSEDGNGIELRPGYFEMSFPASPLSKDGTFYDTPNNTIKFNLDRNLGSEFVIDHENNFKKAEMWNVTDDQINNAANIAKQLDDQKSKIDDYVKATKEARDKALSAKQQQDQVAAKAAKISDFQKRNEEIYNKYVALISGGGISSAGDGRGMQARLKNEYDALMTDICNSAKDYCSPDIQGQLKDLSGFYDSGKNKTFIQLYEKNDTTGINKFYYDTVNKMISLLSA